MEIKRFKTEKQGRHPANRAYREIETQGKLFFCFKFRDRVYVSVIGHLLF